MAGRSVTDKVLAVIFPITAFVALGCEHSVANMFFIPAGLLAQTEIGTTMLVSEQLTIGGFFWHNLIPVTLGNMLGGSIFVGLFYWFIYLRK
jgi:formate/nitrite transporter FocA (FNT family)